jgi:hypothetical protein
LLYRDTLEARRSTNWTIFIFPSAVGHLVHMIAASSKKVKNKQATEANIENFWVHLSQFTYAKYNDPYENNNGRVDVNRKIVAYFRRG